jgi:hypothetical protein
MKVSFDDCRRELLERGGRSALNTYRSWLNRPGYEAVHDFVHGFQHDYLFNITYEEIVQARKASDHALGDVKKEEQLREVEDWTTPFAFQHLFHRFLEEERQVPTWQTFSKWLNKPAAAFFIDPLFHHVKWSEADRQQRQWLRRAFRWRLGKFYYSAMRELDLMVRLQSEYGVPIRYHLLADVLLRTDFWLNSDIICVYFANPKYRAGNAGRKPPAETFMGRADPPFRIHHVEITRQGFGKFWVASDESIKTIATILATSTKSQ